MTSGDAPCHWDISIPRIECARGSFVMNVALHSAVLVDADTRQGYRCSPASWMSTWLGWKCHVGVVDGLYTRVYNGNSALCRLRSHMEDKRIVLHCTREDLNNSRYLCITPVRRSSSFNEGINNGSPGECDEHSSTGVIVRNIARVSGIKEKSCHSGVYQDAFQYHMSTFARS